MSELSWGRGVVRTFTRLLKKRMKMMENVRTRNLNENLNDFQLNSDFTNKVLD